MVVRLSALRTDRLYPQEILRKSVPLEAWSGPEGSRNLRFPDYMKTAQDGGEVVSLTHGPSLPPGNAAGTRFFERPSRTRKVTVRSEGFYVNEKFQ